LNAIIKTIILLNNPVLGVIIVSIIFQIVILLNVSIKMPFSWTLFLSIVLVILLRVAQPSGTLLNVAAPMAYIIKLF
jgi:hypothetical protein